MNSWNLNNVPANQRKHFIIKCLQEYIDEANKLDVKNSPYVEDIVTNEVAELYKAIIEELNE